MFCLFQHATTWHLNPGRSWKNLWKLTTVRFAFILQKWLQISYTQMWQILPESLCVFVRSIRTWPVWVEWFNLLSSRQTRNVCLCFVGLRGLEIVPPEAVTIAARLFHRDGFVVVKDVLTPEQSSRLRHTCDVLTSCLLENKNVNGAKKKKKKKNRSNTEVKNRFVTTWHTVLRQKWGDRLFIVDVCVYSPLRNDAQLCNFCFSE